MFIESNLESEIGYKISGDICCINITKETLDFKEPIIFWRSHVKEGVHNHKLTQITVTEINRN